MRHEWTFMVYMAGDNGRIFKDGMQLMDNLEGYGWIDIKEMSSVGSTDEVAILVQYDTLDATETPRFFIDGSNETGTLVERVPPVNTGDPKNLTDFIVWGIENYPAKNYALVLWNHGTGWKEEDIYARYRRTREIAHRDHQVRAVGSRKRMLKHAFFLPTAATIMSVEDDQTRAICYDDTSMDFLDNRDLVKAFRGAEERTGGRLSVLGMDACLMSMVEVAYQVREHADYMVGSQEVEEGYGWPYDAILQELVGSPEMSPLDLSKLIVTKFGEYYMGGSRDGGGINTQAAVDLHTIPRTFAKIKALSGLVAGVYTTDFKTELAVTRAQRDAEDFEDEDYVDLRHLMQCIRDEYSGSLEVRDLASDLVEHLTPEATASPIVENFHGLGRPNANGLSIYFPTKRYSPFYDKQAFTLSGWNKVIRRANRVKAPELKAVAESAGTRAASSTAHLIVCPVCEGVIQVPANIAEIGETVETGPVRDLVEQIVAAIQQALASPTAEASQWIDLSCLHCGHTFHYYVKTGETRR
ncbi:hypothetical protein GF348_24205 [candidate division KSB3 bacterium]|nr:hypothetical protein [candidate division KSB3 bacterium]